MNKNDILIKSIIEDVFFHFLKFFFANAEKIFDFTKPPVFLDKELAQLFPPEKDQYEVRHVDKLVKVFTKEGTEEWILIHVEVQGYDDSDFALRMFKYYTRIFDKYGVRISALVIFTDDSPSFHPKQFTNSFLGTELTYRFNTYKVLDQSEEALQQSDNPFAIVVLTVLLALKGKKMKDTEVYRLKFDLVRRLYAKNFDKQTIRALMNFIREYVRFDNKALNDKFDNEIELITQDKTTMGIEEFLLERARREGEKRGEKRGIEKGRQLEREKAEQLLEEEKRRARELVEQEKRDVVINLIQKSDFNNEQIAEIAGVSVRFVEQIKKEFNLG